MKANKLGDVFTAGKMKDYFIHVGKIIANLIIQKGNNFCEGP